MKKYLIYLIVLPIAFVSCVGNVDDLFDKSASQRVDDAVIEYDEILRGNANGWVVEYYPESGQAYGGFNLYFKFEDNDRVIVGSDIDSDVLVESLYSMNVDQGPTLNFDTYNEVLNYFSDPSLPVGGGTGYGFEGDYEFVIKSASASEVIMMGKKTRNTIRMTPLADGLTWSDYFAQIDEMYDNLAAPNYLMTIAGVEMESVSRYYNGFTISYSEEIDGEEVTSWVWLPFICTPKGIKLYEPVTILGQTMQEFTYDASRMVFDSDDSDAQIYTQYPLVNEYFCNSTQETQWTFFDFSPAFNEYWLQAYDNMAVYSFVFYKWNWVILGKGYLNVYLGPCFFGVLYQTTSGGFATVGYKFDFETVDGTEDQITLTYTGPVSDATTAWIGNVLLPVVNALNDNSPYRLTPNYRVSPHQIRLESVNNPDIYFIVENNPVN